MKGKTSKLVMLLISFAFILLFQFIPAPAGSNQTSMQVIGIFIGIMLMWNFIGTDWPSLLCMAILAIFQIMSPGISLKAALATPPSPSCWCSSCSATCCPRWASPAGWPSGFYQQAGPAQPLDVRDHVPLRGHVHGLLHVSDRGPAGLPAHRGAGLQGAEV